VWEKEGNDRKKVDTRQFAKRPKLFVTLITAVHSVPSNIEKVGDTVLHCIVYLLIGMSQKKHKIINTVKHKRNIIIKVDTV